MSAKVLFLSMIGLLAASGALTSQTCPTAFNYILTVPPKSDITMNRDLIFEVYMSSVEDTTAQVTLPWSPDPVDVSLDAANGRSWSQMYPLIDGAMYASVVAFGIRVSSDVALQLSASSKDGIFMKAYTALPLTDDATEFYLGSYMPLANYGLSSVLLVAGGDTAAAVNVTAADGSVVQTLSVPPGAVRSYRPFADLTGARVTSDVPVAVYAGTECSFVPEDTYACDSLLQPMPPVSRLGQRYMVGPMSGRQNFVGYTVRVVATAPDTVLTVDYDISASSPSVVTSSGGASCSLGGPGGALTCPGSGLQPGQFLEVRSDNSGAAHLWWCSQPCLVMQYNHGGTLDLAYGSIRTDPFMVAVSALGSSSTSAARFSTTDFEVDTNVVFLNFMNVVAHPAAGVLVDGAAITTLAPSHQRVGGLDVFSVSASEAFHEVTASGPGDLLSVTVYGHSTDMNSGYGMTAGQDFCPPEEPESAYDCVCSAAAGTLTTYDGTALNIPFGAEAKQLASRWAADGSDPCKYQLRVITENAAVSWITLSVGVHTNSKKYWRNFAFNRYNRGGVEMRGWKMSGAEDLTLPFHWEGDATAVSIYSTDDGGVLLNSTTCPYELRYDAQASGSESMFKLSVSGDKYQTTSDDLRGWCQNCNGDASDDVRRCDTLADVSGVTDTYTQIADSCREDDDSLITI